MKSRLLWIAILTIGLTALYFGVTQPNVSSIPSQLREPLADLKPPGPPPLEPPVLTIPPLPTIAPPAMRPITRVDPILPPQEVPIQDGATIDFSTGGPAVRSYGKDDEALKRALKEIADSTKGVTFEAKK